MKSSFKILLITAISCLSACGGGGGSPKDNAESNGSGTGSTEAFNYRAITDDDLAKVKGSWKARDLTAKEVRVIYEHDDTNYHVSIYEHKIDTRKHYGLVATPLKTQQVKLPIEIKLGGYNENDPTEDGDYAVTHFTEDAILVIPAFRGRTLKYNGMSFSADGDNLDVFDGPTDDTIALLNVVEANTPSADINRVLISGYSRGANVAFLLGARDSRVNTIVAVAAPVDFYRKEVRDLQPNLIQKIFFTGKTADETRQAMLAASPLRFDMLPNVKKVFLFQASGDVTVAPSNAQEMNDHLLAQKIDVNFYLYQGYGHAEIWNNQDFVNTWSQAHADFVHASSTASETNNWQLVWNDEFDGQQLDTTKWQYDQQCLNAGVELQCYTNRTDNVFLSDGKLHLLARKETFTGPRWGDETKSITQDYTSGSLHSLSGKWTYGRIEVRAKMPQGHGMHPAIWMMPVAQNAAGDGKYGAWPASGEIDILEAFSPNTGGSSGDTHSTLIYGEAWPGARAITGVAHTPASNIWDNYHSYTLEWDADEMRWYFDDLHYATQTKAGWFTLYGPQGEKKFSTRSEPFDQDFFLILNLAISDLPDTSNLPQEMTVDYVRVYKCTLDAVNGKGCATNVNKAVTPSNETPKKYYVLFANGDNNLAATNKNIAVTTYADTSVISDPAMSADNTTVWDLQFNQWPKRASLQWQDQTDAANPIKNFTLGSMGGFGQIRFDIFVESQDTSTRLNVKMDSGGTNNSSYPLTNLKKGEWQTLAIPFVNLVPNGSGSVRFGSVTSPFSIEAEGGAAHIKLNNVRLECIGENCGFTTVIPGKTLTDSFNVFIDAVDPMWTRGLNAYNDPGNSQTLQFDIVDDSAEGRGKILDLQWPDQAGQNSLLYIESGDAKDATAFADNGYVSFDIKVLSYGSTKNGFQYYIWCGFPCGDQGPVPDVPNDGQWHSVTMPIKPFANFGLNLKMLTDPFVFSPSWRDQQGAHVQLDNIKWVLP